MGGSFWKLLDGDMGNFTRCGRMRNVPTDWQDLAALGEIPNDMAIFGKMRSDLT